MLALQTGDELLIWSVLLVPRGISKSAWLLYCAEGTPATPCLLSAKPKHCCCEQGTYSGPLSAYLTQAAASLSSPSHCYSGARHLMCIQESVKKLKDGMELIESSLTALILTELQQSVRLVTARICHITAF